MGSAHERGRGPRTGGRRGGGQSSRQGNGAHEVNMRRWGRRGKARRWQAMGREGGGSQRGREGSKGGVRGKQR